MIFFIITIYILCDQPQTFLQELLQLFLFPNLEQHDEDHGQIRESLSRENTFILSLLVWSIATFL